MGLTKHNSFFILIGFFITVFIYFPGLSGNLMLDDGPQLMPLIQAITAENWTTEFKQYVISTSGHLGRPISMTTFILNAAAFGKNLWYWKLTNVMFHILSSIAVFLLTKVLLSFDNTLSRSKLTWVSLSISFLWLIHPLHISTVLYIVQRMTILATLFDFLALACFIQGIKKECDKKNGTYYFLCAFFLFFPLALFSKESGILFPVLALLINQYLLSKSRYSEEVKQRTKPYIAILWSILLIGFFGVIYFFDSYIIESYKFREFTLSERLLTQSRVIFLYLYQVLFPIPSSMGFYHDDIELSKNLFSPYSTFFSVIGLLVCISSLIINFKKWGLFGLGCLFYFCSHLLESTFIALEIAFEHRNYMGSWGIMLACSSLLLNLPEKYYYSNVLLIALVLSSLTFYRSSIWGNPSLMYPHMQSIHPQSLRLKIIFADTYFQTGQYDKAESFLAGEKSLGANLQRLTIQCKKTGQIDNNRLLQLIKEGDIIGTYEMEGIITLANQGLDEKCRLDKEIFIEFLQTILQFPVYRNIAEQKILLYKAHYHYALDQFNLALITLENSYTRYPSNPIPLFLKIEWLIEANQYSDASLLFKKVKRVSINSRHNYAEFETRISTALDLHDKTKNEKF